MAAKTDKLDARVLAELARRDLVPEVWVPSFGDRELKERLGRRMHLVRLRTSAINRAHGVLSSSGSGSRSSGCASPTPPSCSSAAASPRCGGGRSPRPSPWSTTSTRG